MKREDKHHLSIQKNREGIDFIKNGEKDTAYEYFCEAINLNPKYPPPYFNLGNLLMEKKLYKKAIENYIKSNTLDKKNIQYKIKLGLAYAESGEFKNSIKVFEELLNEENDNLEILEKNCKDLLLLETYFLYLKIKSFSKNHFTIFIDLILSPFSIKNLL